MDDETRRRVAAHIDMHLRGVPLGVAVKTDDIGISRQDLVWWAVNEAERELIRTRGCLVWRDHERGDQADDIIRFCITGHFI